MQTLSGNEVLKVRSSCPQGSCPKGSCPKGSCPKGSCPVTCLVDLYLQNNTTVLGII